MKKSFKDYELKTKEALKFVDKGKKVTLYPYDMFLVTYSKIANYLNKDNQSEEDLGKLLSEMEKIKQKYHEHNNRT